MLDSSGGEVIIRAQRPALVATSRGRFAANSVPRSPEEKWRQTGPRRRETAKSPLHRGDQRNRRQDLAARNTVL